MINAGTRPERRRFRPSIGGMFAAALLAIGFKDVVEGLNDPLAALLVSFVNFLLERKHVQINSLAVPSVFWSLSVKSAVTGLMVLALSMRIGFWLNRKAWTERERPKSTASA